MHRHLARPASRWFGFALLAAVGCSAPARHVVAPRALAADDYHDHAEDDQAQPTAPRQQRRVSTLQPHGGWYPDARNGLRIPGGETCVNWLQDLGVPFTRLSSKPGVETPVEITGPIGGISYTGQGKDSIICDCRLALALDWSSRVLRPLGVTRVRHMGVYVNRTTRRGRPSLHARGLAIDVGAVRVGNQWLKVEDHFQRNTADTCDSSTPLLNSVSCQLRTLRLFRELITPDDDGDHHNHLHLALPLRPR